MMNYIQSQLETADRLVELMQKDHAERLEIINVWVKINTDLIKKLEQRDALIADLRAQLAALEVAEHL